MNNFHIKKISEIDKNRLLQFYQNSFNYKNNNLNIFNWRYRSGFSNFEPIVLVIDNEIRGHAGLIANDLKIDGKIKTGIWFTDFYIDKKYRSQGYGRLLTEAWMKICPIQITLCNHKSLKIFKKMNWTYNNKFLRQIEISNFLNFVPILNQLKISSISFDDIADLKIKEVDNHTISKIASESETILSQKSFGIIRDEKWFKWRVLNCPNKKNIYIFSYKEINIIAEVKIKNRFRILNIIYISKPIKIDLKNLFSNFNKKNKINFISYISKNNKSFNIDFPWSRKLNFAFYAENSSVKKLINDNFDDLQYIDSDINFI